MNALEYQRQVYLDGFSGQTPVVPADWSLLEKRAHAKMSHYASAYVCGGAGLQETIRHNRLGFNKWQIVPRMLRDVERIDTKVNLFGMKLPAPILLSPVGVLEMVHPEADVAVGKAAAGLGLPYILSNQASVPMETVTAAMGNSPRLFQLYWSKSRPLVASLLHRAETSGCQGIVVTLDTTSLGWRTPDLTNAYLPFLWGKGIAQYTSDPIFQQLLDGFVQRSGPTSFPLSPRMLYNLYQTVVRYPVGPNSPWDLVKKWKSGRPIKAVQLFTSIYTNQKTTWDSLSFLRQHTKLPILLKGILHPDDAQRTIDAGMDGVIVSNHGGRQVDGSISAIEALPNVVAAVNGQVPVLMDSGIRGGADVFKALSLGATAVCVGRPYVYGLTLAGQAGVREVMRQLMADFELTMRLSGCQHLSDLRSGAYITPARHGE